MLACTNPCGLEVHSFVGLFAITPKRTHNGQMNTAYNFFFHLYRALAKEEVIQFGERTTMK